MGSWLLIALVAAVVLYSAFVGALVLLGRREDARAWARFIPDCVVLFTRLAGDARIPRRRRALLVVLIAYLAFPLDLVPDFIPVAGQLDDAIAVAFVLRVVLRGAGPALVAEHWPGPERSLRTMLRLATSGRGLTTLGGSTRMRLGFRLRPLRSGGDEQRGTEGP
jgi:uncharacterized membrane protein YkvA (DUF1232 family)